MVALSPPPPDHADRALDAIITFPIWARPGQSLPRCATHPHSTSPLPCAWELDRLWMWPPGHFMPEAVVYALTRPCWLKVSRRKQRAAEYRRALDDRRHRIPTGYRNHAHFEAAAHWHLCIGTATALQVSLDSVCSCPAEYRSWFASELLRGPDTSIVFTSATGAPP